MLKWTDTYSLNLMWCKFLYFCIPTYPNFLTPKILKMCDPILVTLIKMQPHNSKFSRENETPGSTPPPHPLLYSTSLNQLSLIPATPDIICQFKFEDNFAVHFTWLLIQKVNNCWLQQPNDAQPKSISSLWWRARRSKRQLFYLSRVINWLYQL